ncbi:hypothetical protein TKK_0014598 [Trichogramma kaykai]
MLHDKSLPIFLWAEAVNTAVYTLNRTVSSRNFKKTPFELWHGYKPSIGHVRPFGTCGFVHIPEIQRAKFDAKAKKVILVGYDEHCDKNYRLFDANSRRVIIACEVKFYDTEPQTSIQIPIRSFVEHHKSLITQEDDRTMDSRAREDMDVEQKNFETTDSQEKKDPEM